jgi:hypothetical protein
LESPRAVGLFDSPEPAPGAGLKEEEDIPPDDHREFGEDEEDADEVA